MSQCADDGDMFLGAKNNMGNGYGEISNSWQEEPDVSRLNNQRANDQRRAAVESELSNAAAGAGPSGMIASVGDNRTANGIARQVIADPELVALSEKGREERYEYWNKVKDYANGLNVGDVSMWQNFKFKTAKAFVNARTDLHKWLWIQARDKDKLPYMQPIAQAFDQMDNKINALRNIFGDRHRRFLADLVPVSKRTGHSTSEIAQGIGIIANCDHMPEANALLLKRWGEQYAEKKARVDALVAAGYDIENPALIKADKEATDILNKINQLEANLENPVKPDGLVSAGYTNAQARQIRTDMMAKYKLSEDEANALAERLRQEVRFITEERAKAGMIDPAIAAAFPDFKKYVPLYSKKLNRSGAPNDANIYNPGSYHMLDGMEVEPESAWASLVFYANRAATEMGMQEFATHMAAVQIKLKKDNRASPRLEEEYAGLRMASYSELQRWRRGKSEQLASIANDILNNGGLVTDVPVVTPDGKRTMERKYIWFDTGWEKDGMTGQMLNDAISASYKSGSKLVDTLGNLSGYHGQMFTRFQPGFAPIAMMRDFMERSLHMTNRTYYNDAGGVVSGASLLPAFMKNTARAGQMLYSAMRGKADADSLAAQFYDEYQRQGLLQKFTPGVKQESKSAEDLLTEKHKLGFLSRWLAGTGRAKDAILRTIDGYNDYLQNVAAFNQYITLREAGINADAAGKYTLELMNMRHSGTFTPYLRIVSPFVVPTMQSAAALGRTLGFGAANLGDIIKQGRNGWLAVLGGAAAFGALHQLSRDTMGYSDDGVSYYDRLPFRDAISYTCIGIDDNGGFAKMPNGFGPIRLASALSLAMDRVSRGIMTAEDAAVEIMFAVGKDVVPTTMPQFDFGKNPAAFIGQIVTPDIIKPLIETMANTNYFGSEIYRASNRDKAKADQGRASTDVFWHNVARKMMREYGLDMAPEQYQHLAKSYFVGPMRLFGALLDTTFSLTGQMPRKGEQNPSAADEMGPWLQALGGNMWYGKVRNPAQGMYFDYIREVDDKIQRLGLQMTDRKNSGNSEASLAYKREQLENSGQFTPQEIDDYVLMLMLNQQLSKLNRDFNSQYKDSWMNMENSDELRAAFEDLFTNANDIYSRFVSESNFYRNMR